MTTELIKSKCALSLKTFFTSRARALDLELETIDLELEQSNLGKLKLGLFTALEISTRYMKQVLLVYILLIDKIRNMWLGDQTVEHV